MALPRSKQAGRQFGQAHTGVAPQRSWKQALAVVASIASACTGFFVFAPAAVAKADVAQRTSWNTATHQLYRLEGNNGSTWVPLDPSKLVLSVTPTVASTAVLSAFVDVESSTSLNAEIGIAVNGIVVAYKDGGEYTGSSPDPVYVQHPMPMNANSPYTLELMWRATSAEGPGVFLEAGDPVPTYGPGFSPSTLNALLTPNPDTLTPYAESTGTQPLQFTTSSTTWQLMDSSVETSFTTPTGSSNFSTLLTASADLYSSSAYSYSDMGICLVAAATVNSSCNSGANIIAAKTSGAAAGAMPIASLVEATQTLAPNTTYTMGIFWQSEAGHAIYAGVGTTGAWSLVSLIGQMTPTSDNELSTVATTGIQTRTYSTSDDGTAWTTLGSETFSLTPTVNVLTYLTANATLAINTGSDPIDYAICVASGTGNSCDAAGDNIVAETASRVLPPTPDAAYLQIPVFMSAGTAYTVTLEWRAGFSMSGTESMTAGRTISAGAFVEQSTLTSLEVPYSAPSAPPSASATAGNGQATVTWTAPTTSPGSPLSGYAITPYLGATALESLRVGNITSLVVPNLANGQQYSFTVAGVNGVGPGAIFTTGTVTPGLPGAPTGVTIGMRGNGFENLSWTAPTAPGASAITGYLITPFIAGVAQATTTLWGTATSNTMTGLTDGTNYTFGVAAINVFGTGLAGNSGSNNPYKQTPGAPTGVSGAAGNAQATIGWTAPANNGGAAISSYTITPYIAGVAQSTTSASASPATVTGLTNGTTYTFTVAAVNSIGTGAASSNSWAVIPATTAIVPTLTMAVDEGTAATYAIGTEVTYTATIASNAGTATTASFSDPLPTGVSGTGGLVEVNGAACTGGTTCSATATAISVAGLTVPATGNVVVTYSLTVTGSLSQCAKEPDNASVTLAGGNSVGAFAQFTACDSGLGAAAWDSFIPQTLGDGGSARVNPANGNLVVTQTDAIPMALHGSLSFHLSRTYNSEDKDLAGLPEPVGNGWIVSFVDAGPQPGGVALILPAIESYANPTPITMVDGSGTRYVYTPSALSSVINVGSLSTTGPLATVIPNNLPKTSGYNQRCIDEEYNPPTGLHVSMWRYVETMGTCATLSTSTDLVLGYVAIGTDRIRREYNANGELINLMDAVGNTVFYTYTSGQLTAVTETGNSRKFKLAYAGSTVTITDPGGERTVYTLAANNDLNSVANPDGTSLAYTYGTMCNGDSYKQLCSATDGRANATNFTYQVAPNGPPMIATIVDRNGDTTTITYNSTNVTADRGSERTAFAAIDASGRVGEIDAGSTANMWLTRAFYGWDTSALGCRQPDAGVDNDLCYIVRRGLTAGAPDRVTDYTYGDEGQMLSQRDVDYPIDLYTTAGYQEQYFEAGVSVSTYTDTVAGSGSVTSTTQTGGRRDAATLFDVTTQIQSLTPNGNAAGSGYGAYEATYSVDNNAAVSTNTVNGASALCSSPAAPVANSGLLCQIKGAAYDTNGDHPLTNYTYNPDGSRATMVTPIETAGLLTTHYTYTYYQNTDLDLSGTTSAGGWLKGITDPTNNFTAFAYDAEGHQVRSWDRDATAASGGTPLSSSNWSSLSSGVAPLYYTEKLYTKGADTLASTFSAPGRHVLASRTQMDDWTTEIIDPNGNMDGTQSPKGTLGDPTSSPRCPQSTTTQTFDTCMTYDKDDNLTSTLTPMEAYESYWMSTVQYPTTYVYDVFDNRIAVTDPNGNVTVTTYDHVNRPITAIWTMAASGAMPTPSNCRISTSGDAPIPSGRILCQSATAYDGTGNTISSTDGNGNPTYTLYDADHRVVSSIVPRGGVFSNVVTTTLYDPDGRATDVCSGRELSEGSAEGFVCGVNATYATHAQYFPDGLVSETYDYQTAGTQLKTIYTYDPDGNKATVENADSVFTTYSFSELDRMSQTSVPQTSAQTDVTVYAYDPSGDVLTEHQQTHTGTVLIRTVYTYDFDHRVIETIQGASSDTSTADYNSATGTDVRTWNLYDPDGNVTEQYQPNAFAGSGSVGSPDADYATAAAYNADDQRVAVYRPRYDTNAAHTPLLTNPVGTTGTQESQCPTGGTHLYGFPSTTGVCTTSYVYDPNGNVARVNWPTQVSGGDANPFTTYTYTDTNLVLTDNIANPNTGFGGGGRVAAETYAYDADGKQVDVTDAVGISTQTGYTNDELVATSMATPNASITHNTSYLYDAAGELIDTTDAMGNSTLTSYYPNGLTYTVSDALGDETKYAYDGVGNPVEVWSPDAIAAASADPTGRPTYNVYTENNLLEATLIPYTAANLQRAVCYAYDEAGRKTGEGGWLNGTGSWQTGEPSGCSSGLPAGSFAFTTLADGRLATETGRNGSSTLTYTYDANGNQITAIDSSVPRTTTNTYYADNLMRTNQDYTAGRVTDYTYDGAGKVTLRKSSQSGYPTYTDTMTYNDADLEASETNSVTGTTETWFYDANGRLGSGSYSGVTLGNGDREILYYANDGTLDDSSVWNSLPPIPSSLSYFVQTFDGDFRVTSDGCTCLNTTGTTNIGHTFTYQYDAASRLIFINASGGYAAFQTYDPSGNRITHDDVTTDAYTNYTYNGDNSIATTILSGTTPLTATYNVAGVMTGDGCKSWTLDTFDRAATLAKATNAPAACPTAPTATTYSYDANGDMVSQKIGSTTSTIQYDAVTNTPMVEVTGSTVTGYSLDANGTPIVVTQGSTTVYPVDDPKGDASTIIASNGNWPTCQIQYDPYGTVAFSQPLGNVCENGSTFDDLLYQNNRVDSQSGDYQLGSRTYDPSKNSFLSPDHFELGTPAQDLSIAVDPLTANAYAFVNGDPVNRFDPTGHSYTTGNDPSDSQGSTTCATCYTQPTQYVQQTSHGPVCGTSCQRASREARARAVAADEARRAAARHKAAGGGAYGFTAPQIAYLSSQQFLKSYLSAEDYACSYQSDYAACGAMGSMHPGQNLMQCILIYGPSCDNIASLGNLGMFLQVGGGALTAYAPNVGAPDALARDGEELEKLGDGLGNTVTIVGGVLVAFQDWADHGSLSQPQRIVHAAIVGVTTSGAAAGGAWAGGMLCSETGPGAALCAGAGAFLAANIAQPAIEWALDGDQPTQTQIACTKIFGPNC